MSPRPADRRTFLFDFGRLAVATLVLGGCADATGSSADIEPPSTETSDPPTPDPTIGTTVSPSISSPATDALEPEWQRVDLEFVSAYVLVRDGTGTIVDTGVRGSEDAIGDALTELGASWGDLAHIIVTHSHPDHAGSLRSITEAAPQAAVYAGHADISNMDSATEISAVDDGQTVAGLEVVATPGHTPGHISIIDPVAGWLLAGDALNGAAGAIAGPNPQFSSDMTAALASARKLATEEFDTAVFGHGPPVIGGAKSQLETFLATL